MVGEGWNLNPDQAHGHLRLLNPEPKGLALLCRFPHVADGCRVLREEQEASRLHWGTVVSPTVRKDRSQIFSTPSAALLSALPPPPQHRKSVIGQTLLKRVRRMGLARLSHAAQQLMYFFFFFF